LIHPYSYLEELRGIDQLKVEIPCHPQNDTTKRKSIYRMVWYGYVWQGNVDIYPQEIAKIYI